VYFAVTVNHSYYLVRKAPIGKHWKQTQKILFSMVIPISIFVTIVFWILLSPTLIFQNVTDSDWLKAVAGFDHLIQFLMAIGEVLFSDFVLDWVFVLAPTVFIICYSVLIVIMHTHTGIWPYGFMDALFGTTNVNTLIMVIFVVVVEIIMVGLFAITKYCRQWAQNRFTQ
jgi:uncharacterized membrane protein